MSMTERRKPEEVPDERTQYSIEKYTEYRLTEDGKARFETSEGWIEASYVLDL